MLHLPLSLVLFEHLLLPSPRQQRISSPTKQPRARLVPSPTSRHSNITLASSASVTTSFALPNPTSFMISVSKHVAQMPGWIIRGRYSVDGPLVIPWSRSTTHRQTWDRERDWHRDCIPREAVAGCPHRSGVWLDGWEIEWQASKDGFRTLVWNVVKRHARR